MPLSDACRVGSIVALCVFTAACSGGPTIAVSEDGNQVCKPVCEEQVRLALVKGDLPSLQTLQSEPPGGRPTKSPIHVAASGGRLVLSRGGLPTGSEKPVSFLGDEPGSRVDVVASPEALKLLRSRKPG